MNLEKKKIKESHMHAKMKKGEISTLKFNARPWACRLANRPTLHCPAHVGMIQLSHKDVNPCKAEIETALCP